MANYAIGPRRANTNMFQNKTPTFGQNPFLNELFDEFPEQGFARWLGMLGPTGNSPINQDFLRRMFSQYHNDYAQRMFSDPEGSEYPELSWMEYLASRNPQRDLMSYSPTARGSQPSRFTRPNTRWVSFG